MLADAVSKWGEADKPWLSVILAALAFFTFFFRSKFAKKFAVRDKPNNSNQS
jgi:hypothetical protein